MFTQFIPARAPAPAPARKKREIDEFIQRSTFIVIDCNQNYFGIRARAGAGAGAGARARGLTRRTFKLLCPLESYRGRGREVK